jgi:hypothetical protein
VVKHAQDALNLQWAVPRFGDPASWSEASALVPPAVVGVGIIAATAATSLAAFLPDLPWQVASVERSSRSSSTSSS